MFNTIFKKQFLLYFSILIISFTLLGISLSIIFKSYFYQKKKEQLIFYGLSISNAYTNIYLENYVQFDLELPIIDEISENAKQELQNLEKFLNINYILLDENFIYVASSKEIIENPAIPFQTPEFPEILNKQIYIFEGNFFGFFKEDLLNVGCPIFIDEVFKGVIFVNSSIPEIQRSVSEITRTMLIAIIITGAFVFIFIYLLSRSISKPLYDMNQIAKDISSGDFEKRIYIKSKDEIGQLSESLNMMAENLQKQELQRRNFIANISHDLRSPLTSITGFLVAIIDGTIPEEKHEKYLNIVLDETERLQKLANDILDINKVEIVELNLIIFDLNEVIRKIVIQFEKRILDKNINLKVIFESEKQFVYADLDKIQRVIYNLLDNAIKFTNQDGKIKIETSLKDGKIYTSVKDNGIGISKENQRHVFDRFFKADTSRGFDKKGSGLGLSIIKEFIKSHNENIYLTSEINNGTEIVFTLESSEESFS